MAGAKPGRPNRTPGDPVCTPDPVTAASLAPRRSAVPTRGPCSFGLQPAVLVQASLPRDDVWRLTGAGAGAAPAGLPPKLISLPSESR